MDRLDDYILSFLRHTAGVSEYGAQNETYIED